MDYVFENGKYVIKNYDQKKVFASFLPGVAGENGIPMWVYYSNRGQVITSFGTKDKSKPILEFHPANIGYKNVGVEGFRTFLNVNGKFYEPFNTLNLDNKNITRQMMIDFESVGIEEINKDLGFKISVKYFNLVNSSVNSIIRKVEITALKEKLEIELLDGTTMVMPYGVANGEYKELGNLLRSWMEVYNLENKMPFYKLRASSNDTSEISAIDSGNFALSFDENNNLYDFFYDNDAIFDFDKSMQTPVNFVKGNLKEKLTKQVSANKVPSFFAYANKTIEAKEKICINTLIGFVEDLSVLNGKKEEFVNYANLLSKEVESKKIMSNMLNDIDVKTSNNVFDFYLKQSYLDNLLRGGYPINVGDKIFYLYSRKHGDPERDYNWFEISPEYYSQGNGNYRDINQNRRNDVYFNQDVKDFNIKLFLNLVQLNGFNPLVINGVKFNVTKKGKFNTVISKNGLEGLGLEEFLTRSFSLGEAFKIIHSKLDKKESQKVLDKLVCACDYDLKSDFHEGFWVDHFVYNLDLVESYLSVYPEKLSELLYDEADYKFYLSQARIKTRAEKYTVTKNGVRQYNSIEHLHGIVKKNNNNIFQRMKNKKVYSVNLFSKLLQLGLAKVFTLDNMQMGLEMEADKPGWNDAMNGLPGLFGSSVTETIELLRIFKFLENGYNNSNVTLAKEVKEALESLVSLQDKLLSNGLTNMQYWDQTNTLKEDYRAKTGFLLESYDEISSSIVSKFISNSISILEKGMDAAMANNDGILPTYLAYNVSKYHLDENGCVVVDEFTPYKIPNFLEGPAKYIKVFKNEKALNMYKLLKASDIYDNDLKMFKTSGDLDGHSMEIGRIRAFTKGWLERESNFMHMSFKFILSLLQAGFIDEFFEEFHNGLTCFFDPEVYGRSILENCSFIATTNNPNSDIHGQGFVSRLTGANTEVVNMFIAMFIGSNAFTYENNELRMNFKPVLLDSMFVNNVIEYNLFKSIRVKYIKESTFTTNSKVKNITLVVGKNKEVLNRDYLNASEVELLRNKKVKSIEVYFN